MSTEEQAGPQSQGSRLEREARCGLSVSQAVSMCKGDQQQSGFSLYLSVLHLHHFLSVVLSLSLDTIGGVAALVGSRVNF